jgi:hypothetical protein
MPDLLWLGTEIPVRYALVEETVGSQKQGLGSK